MLLIYLKLKPKYKKLKNFYNFIFLRSFLLNSANFLLINYIYFNSMHFIAYKQYLDKNKLSVYKLNINLSLVNYKKFLLLTTNKYILKNFNYILRLPNNIEYKNTYFNNLLSNTNDLFDILYIKLNTHTSLMSFSFFKEILLKNNLNNLYLKFNLVFQKIIFILNIYLQQYILNFLLDFYKYKK